MKRLNIPPIQDISRIVGATDKETLAALIKYYSADAGSFNYSLSQKISRFVFARETTLDMAYQACARERTEAGRNQNQEVLKLVWDAGSERRIRSYEVAPKVFSIRQDLQIKVSPSFYFVENNRANVFWLQPRRHFALNNTQLGLLASILRMTFLIDDFQDVGLELLDLSVTEGNKERQMRTLPLDSFPLLQLSEVEVLLQRFARAYDTVTVMGIQRKKRKPRRPQAGPDLFGQT